MKERGNSIKGFMHLDPHPGNIMLDKGLENSWFIDLECSDFNIYNKDINRGFLCGHYFHYYAHRFLDLASYDVIVQKNMKPHFKIENEKLRDSDVKKRGRFAHFLSKAKSNDLELKYS